MRHRQSIPPTSSAWDFCVKQLRSLVLCPVSFITSAAGRPRKVGKVPVFVFSWAGSGYCCGTSYCNLAVQRIYPKFLLTGKTELTIPRHSFYKLFFFFPSDYCLLPSMVNLLHDLETSVGRSWNKHFGCLLLCFCHRKTLLK